MRFGIDVSFWDGKINWELAKDKLDFVFIKAYEKVEDPMFKYNWENTRGKIPRGAYYFWRQAVNATDAFLKTVGGSNYDGELPLVIDYEDPQADRSKAHEQMDILSERIKQVTGRYPIIYTGLNYWNTTSANKVTKAWCNAHPLWISLPNIDYHKTFEAEYQEIMLGNRLPQIPIVPNFPNIDFIQWTYRGKPEDIPGYPKGLQADGTTAKKAIDFNLYLGTEDRWNQLTKNSVVVKPELTLEEKVQILWNAYIKTDKGL